MSVCGEARRIDSNDVTFLPSYNPGFVSTVSVSLFRPSNSLPNVKMAIALFIMSAVLAVSTFAIGMLPLLYAFSSSSSRSVTSEQYIYYIEIESHLERLSALGTGLLLGVALGVIIPEYVPPRVFSP